MATIDPTAFSELVEPALRSRSGKVFYSGPGAFSAPVRLYLLGLNPGGSAKVHAENTIGRNLEQWVSRSERWSEYRDESWEGAEPGKYGMAPRVLHLLDQLGLDPYDVPAANVVFVRSHNEAALAAEKRSLLAKCWPVHHAIINALGIDTILCFGGTAGRWVRSLLSANELVGRFVETNARRWESAAHLSSTGTCVMTLTHPSRADWTNAASDPSPLVREMLAR